MSAKREELQAALLGYTKDTLTFIHTVRTFCEMSTKWVLHRETDLNMLIDIKDRAENLEMTIGQVFQSEEKGKAFKKYMKKAVGPSVASQRAELQEELTKLLKDTLQGLEKIASFLEAVEKLAATSLHVFTENQMLRLPKGVGLDYLQVVVSAAKEICPLVLEFKMDAEPFFLPKLQNVEVLAYQLDKYIQTTNKICHKFGKSCFSDFGLEAVGETVVDLDEDLPEEDVRRMLDHINQQVEIRDDPHFRMAFLFQQESGQHFITQFQERQPRMLTFLKDLEETAVQLDRMKKGASISNVAGSSVGAVGGILSIVGLVLIPFTAGVSLPLTLAGVGLGITSGVNSIVTTASEIGVNATQQKKACSFFQSFMEDVQSLQKCVDEAKCQTVSKLRTSKVEVTAGVAQMACKVGAIGKAIDSMVDGVSALKLLKTEQVAANTAKVLAEEGAALRNVPRLASEIPDISQAAAKGAAALSKSARVGFIALNALFLGMDVFMISKESISLANGSETQVSQFIRARAGLWSSAMDSWQKMFDALTEVLPTLEKKEAILETPFYPEVEELEKQEEELPDDVEEEPNAMERPWLDAD